MPPCKDAKNAETPRSAASQLNGSRTRAMAAILPFSDLLDIQVKMLNCSAVKAGAHAH
jgi:hypothetical protein